MAVLDVTLEPGFGHNFHKHPDQEEMIIVQAGEIEQWIEREHQVLSVGDSVYIDRDVVHASFNIGAETARLQVVLGPSVGDGGYELVDVAADQPWATLRG
jgi:quercetin dioxygenase-like cupin family protein